MVINVTTMKDIKFTLAACCEAAGRESNEDNYQIIADIATNRHGFTANEELTLGNLGTLLVVCDGMGGMNAGEVASAIAVQTVKDCFCKSKITKDALARPEKFITSAIQAADAAIKAESKRNLATEGMGSTIVLVWLLHGKAYIGWCGDSRAYRYNAVSGLERLSHDHSYVQELVDAGSITEELAFFHPNNNIITRSLGDPRGAAQPDVRAFDIQQGDIYLLCSDGLCGCLQDHQIQEVIEQHHAAVSECRDALWAADEAAGWHDNVTTILAQITAGGIPPVKHVADTSADKSVSASKAKLLRTNRRLKCIIAAILAVVLIAGASIAICCFLPAKDTPSWDADAPSAVEEQTTTGTQNALNEDSNESSNAPAFSTQMNTSSKKGIATDIDKAKQDNTKKEHKDSPATIKEKEEQHADAEEKARQEREEQEQKQAEEGVKQVQDTISAPQTTSPKEVVPEVVKSDTANHQDDITAPDVQLTAIDK